MSSSDQGGYGPPIRFLYMAAIQDALKRGNKEELQGLLDQARTTVKEQGDLAQAIRDLENALK
jgi:hypothetical protein